MQSALNPQKISVGYLEGREEKEMDLPRLKVLLHAAGARMWPKQGAWVG